MRDIIAASQRLTATLEDFEHEATVVYQEIVKPRWDEPFRLPHILWGCVMWCFAHLDRLSAYWKGDASPRGQTERMVDYIEQYLRKPRLTCDVAVQIWRHKLMHIGEPRPLHDPKTGKMCRWLLHWGEQLPREQHFTLEESADLLTLNMALFYLVEEIKHGQQDYLSELNSSANLQVRFEQAEEQLNSGQLKRH